MKFLAQKILIYKLYVPFFYQGKEKLLNILLNFKVMMWV